MTLKVTLSIVILYRYWNANLVMPLAIIGGPIRSSAGTHPFTVQVRTKERSIGIFLQFCNLNICKSRVNKHILPLLQDGCAVILHYRIVFRGIIFHKEKSVFARLFPLSICLSRQNLAALNCSS